MKWNGRGVTRFEASKIARVSVVNALHPFYEKQRISTEAKQVADTKRVAVVFVAASVRAGIEMAPAQIQRIVSEQGNVDSKFVAIGSCVHAAGYSATMSLSRPAPLAAYRALSAD